MIRLRDCVSLFGVSRQLLYSGMYKSTLEFQRRIFGETMFTDESVKKVLRNKGIDADIEPYRIPDDIQSPQGVADMYGISIAEVKADIESGKIVTTEKNGLVYITREEYSKYEGLLPSAEINIDDYMTEVEVAEYLGVSYGTVRNLRTAGKLSCIKYHRLNYYSRELVESVKDTLVVNIVPRKSADSDVEARTYNTSEVALLLNKGVNTILSWTRKGLLNALPKEETGGRGNHYDRDYIDGIVKMFNNTLSVDELSEFLSISKSEAYGLVRSDKIPVHMDIYGVRVLFSDVEKYIKNSDLYEAFKCGTVV